MMFTGKDVDPLCGAENDMIPDRKGNRGYSNKKAEYLMYQEEGMDGALLMVSHGAGV
jgi:hypothetical protein